MEANGHLEAIHVDIESNVQLDLLERLTPSGAEDFITEILCWLLERTDFGARFLDRLMEVGDGSLPEVGRGCIWDTQRSFVLDGVAKRPDMVCESANGHRALIFEHKVGAVLHEGQLNSYRQVGEQQFKQSGLILITARKGQCDQNPDCHLLWRHVHGWLSGWLADSQIDEVTGFVSRSFLRLLEKQGLGPMEQITVQQLRAIPHALEGERRIKSLVNSAAERPYWQNLVNYASTGVAEAGGVERERTFRWGRYGMYLLGSRDAVTWTPGIFVGVMVDSRDHGPPSVNNGEGSGPVACLVVDVHRNWHRQYEESEPFLDLVQELLRRWPSDQAEDWRVHRETTNRWHPCAIYKPLAAVLSNTCTGDDQVDRFIEDVGSIAEAVIHLKEFGLFCNSLSIGP